MTPRQLQIGDVVQLKPGYGMFGCCFLTVTEPKSFGCQGYVQCLGNDGEQGQAYLRPRFEHMEFVGRATFIVGGEEATR
jgi:hypothetical protein